MLLLADFDGDFNRVRRIHGDTFVEFDAPERYLEVDYVTTFGPFRGITTVNVVSLERTGTNWYSILHEAFSYHRNGQPTNTVRQRKEICGVLQTGQRIRDIDVAALYFQESPYLAVINHQQYVRHGENPLKVGSMVEGCSLLGVQGMRLEADEMVLLLPASNLPEHANQVRYFASPLDSCWSDGTQRAWNDSILVNAEDVRFHEIGLPLRKLSSNC